MWNTFIQKSIKNVLKINSIPLYKLLSMYTFCVVFHRHVELARCLLMWPIWMHRALISYSRKGTNSTVNAMPPNIYDILHYFQTHDQRIKLKTPNISAIFLNVLVPDDGVQYTSSLIFFSAQILFAAQLGMILWDKSCKV